MKRQRGKEKRRGKAESRLSDLLVAFLALVSVPQTLLLVEKSTTSRSMRPPRRVAAALCRTLSLMKFWRWTFLEGQL